MLSFQALSLGSIMQVMQRHTNPHLFQVQRLLHTYRLCPFAIANTYGGAAGLLSGTG